MWLQSSRGERRKGLTEDHRNVNIMASTGPHRSQALPMSESLMGQGAPSPSASTSCGLWEGCATVQRQAPWSGVRMPLPPSTSRPREEAGGLAGHQLCFISPLNPLTPLSLSLLLPSGWEAGASFSLGQKQKVDGNMQRPGGEGISHYHRC